MNHLRIYRYQAEKPMHKRNTGKTVLLLPIHLFDKNSYRASETGHHDESRRTHRGIIPRSEAREASKADRRLTGRDKGQRQKILRACNRK